METKFTAEKLQDGFYRITDERGCCMYLLEGNRRAVLIDTGMSDGNILTFLKTLTPLPVDLVLTHAHIDHMYHAKAFRHVYIHERERRTYTEKSQRLMNLGARLFRVKRKRYPVNDFIPLAEGHTYDFGGVRLKCLMAPGHTPGSAVYVDEERKAVFCGDAVGSGAGVWMFLPDSVTVSEYGNGLKHVLKELLPYRNYTFFGGHSGQDEGKGCAKLGYHTFSDMAVLCDLILNHQINPIPIPKIPLKFLRFYRYKRAAMLTTRKKCKKD